ncbi:MAG: DUF4374 domain-containing protein [Prevotellaceae bacterium]|jgi:hypothetical protein|nr:DUF4374 domain-containing protein [Prevotellaceae bacterium]
MYTKKSILKRVILAGFIGCLTLSLVSCNKDDDNKTETEIPVTSVSLDKDSINLPINGTYQLLATVLPENATNKNLQWNSSNTSIATVNNGIVTGVAAGTSTITITSESGAFTASCTATIRDTVVEAEPVGAFFLSVNGESAAYIMLTDNLATGELSITNNVKTLEQTGHTWIFDKDPSVAVGLIYQQGDPGIGLGFSIKEDGTLNEPANFQISSRFTSYGFFDKYALTSVGGITPADNADRSDYVTFNFIDLTSGFALQEKTIPTLNITGNGQQATFSGVVDMGNGEFLTGLVVSQPKDPSQTGGASSGAITYPDSCWVAAFDADLNLKRIYRSDKLSYSSGRFRSQYYSQIGKADDGNVYIFSGSYESTTTKPCGALRINKNATTFDESYYFNIEEKTGGYNFRKVWHIAENYFMLEIYDSIVPTATGTAAQYGIVDVAAKTFKWVTGIPANKKITGTGLPMAYAGKMYFPIVEEGVSPTVYIIDPATAAATKGVSITGASSLNAIGRLTYAK